jgi:hypothetical protein
MNRLRFVSWIDQVHLHRVNCLRGRGIRNSHEGFIHGAKQKGRELLSLFNESRILGVRSACAGNDPYHRN